jgi:hypothetical protein
MKITHPFWKVPSTNVRATIWNLTMKADRCGGIDPKPFLNHGAKVGKIFDLNILGNSAVVDAIIYFGEKLLVDLRVCQNEVYNTGDRV